MSTPAPLLFIIDCYRNPYAGTEGQLYKLLEGLDRSRYLPELAVFRDSAYLRGHALPVPVEVLGINRLLSPVNWLRLYRFFRRKRRAGFRLAHIFFNDASIICPPLLRLLGFRVIISRRDLGFWHTRFNLLPLRINRRLVDRVVVNSRAVGELTMRREGYPAQRVSIIYNGYPVPQSSPPDRPPRAATAPLQVVMVANIRPIKRIEDAMRAVHALGEAGVDCRLTLVGDGDDSGLRDLCSRLGITARVEFAGPSRDVAGLLADFDAGLLCSDSEGFSNTLVEYQLAGLPVVCSAVGGNVELVEHGLNGLLYPAGDIDALAGQLRKLAGNPQRAAAMGRAGQERVKLHYGLSRLLSAHDALYTELLDGS